MFWLVVSNMNFIFHFMYGMSSFPLTFICELIFFKMGKLHHQAVFFHQETIIQLAQPWFDTFVLINLFAINGYQWLSMH